MILFSKSVLMQHAKAKIVYDVKCTRNLKINIINDVIKKSIVEFKKNELDKFLNEN